MISQVLSENVSLYFLNSDSPKYNELHFQMGHEILFYSNMYIHTHNIHAAAKSLLKKIYTGIIASIVLYFLLY